MSDKLDKAIADFEDETLDWSLGDRISNLRQALMWNAFKTMQRIKKYGTKDPVSEEDEYKHIECMRHFKYIERMYESELKMNKMTGKTEESSNNDFLKRIKEMKGSVADIITTIPLSQ